MEKVLTDRTRWADLRARALEQSKGHRWSITAKRTLEAMRQVGENSPV